MDRHAVGIVALSQCHTVSHRSLPRSLRRAPSGSRHHFSSRTHCIVTRGEDSIFLEPPLQCHSQPASICPSSLLPGRERPVRSRSGETAHLRSPAQMQQRRLPVEDFLRVATSTNCPVCMKEYWALPRLQQHLKKSPACLKVFEGADFLQSDNPVIQHRIVMRAHGDM